MVVGPPPPAGQVFQPHDTGICTPYSVHREQQQHSNNMTLTSPDSLDGFAGLASNRIRENVDSNHHLNKGLIKSDLMNAQLNSSNRSNASIDFSVHDLASASSSSLELLAPSDPLLGPVPMGVPIDPNAQPARRPSWFGVPF